MSKQRKPSSATPPVEESTLLPKILWGAAALICAFLAWGSLTGKYLPGCDESGNCAGVLSSKWAYAFGLPVSVVGAAVYAIGAALLNGRTFSERRKGHVAGIALLALLAAGWFIAVQVAVLGQFCVWCMAAHSAGAAGALMILSKANFRKALGAPVAIGAAAAVGVLVIAQVVGRPPAQVLTADLSKGGKITSVATNLLPPVVDVQKAAREIAVHDGEFKFNLNEVPLTGSPNARLVMLSLFDYTCHICRDLHLLLEKAQAVNSNDLAIVHLPMPLDAACNPWMKQTPSAHVNACEHAKIGLAVWQVDAGKFDSFTSQIFATPKPPSLAQARTFATNLVDSAAFEKAFNNGWSQAHLATNIALFRANYLKTRLGKMPQIVLGSKVFAGINTPAQVNAVLQEAGLQPIPADAPTAH